MNATSATEVYCERRVDEVVVAKPAHVALSGRQEGMPYRVVVDGKEEDKPLLMRVLYQAFDVVDEELNVWNEGSRVAVLNGAPVGEWVALTPALCDVLEEVQAAYVLTGGLFDPTVSRAADVFFAALEGVESAEEAEALLAGEGPAIGWDGVEVDVAACRARRTRDVAVDLCGVCKGWWVDDVTASLVTLGYTEAYVEWGGDLRIVGDWDIAVTRPADLGACRQQYLSATADAPACLDGYLCTLPLRTCAVATSGDYTKLRKYGYNPNAFHPATRRPMRMNTTSVSSVTVAAASCMRADALATALMLSESAPVAMAAARGMTRDFDAAAEVHGCIAQSRDVTLKPPADFLSAGVAAGGALGGVWVPFSEGATVPRGARGASDTSRVPRHAHCRDLLRTVPKQLYVLSVCDAAGGVHTVVLSSVVAVGVAGGEAHHRRTLFFSVMNPSKLAAQLVADAACTARAGTAVAATTTTTTAATAVKEMPLREGAKMTLFPVTRALPDPLPQTFRGAWGGGVEALGVRVYLQRIVALGDHLGVYIETGGVDRGADAPTTAALDPAAAVFTQHAGGIAAAPQAGSGRSGGTPQWPLLDTRCLLYPSPLPARGADGEKHGGVCNTGPTAERVVVTGLRLFSRAPHVLSFVAHGGGVEPGDAARVHVIDGGQGVLADVATAEAAIRKLPSRQHGGVVLPCEMGHVDIVVTAVDQRGVVFAEVVAAVSLDRPTTDVLLEDLSGAVPQRVAHPRAPVGNPVPPLVSFVVVLSLLFLLFVYWVVIPHMIDGPPVYDMLYHPSRNRGARGSLGLSGSL